MFEATPSAIVPRGDTPQLKCTVTAVPPANNPEIVRIFSDGTEEVVANVTNPDGERELLLRHVLEGVRFPEDDGAIFECRAINANGEAVERVTIIVQGENKLTINPHVCLLPLVCQLVKSCNTA